MSVLQVLRQEDHDHSLGYVPASSQKRLSMFIITPLSLLLQLCSPPRCLHGEGFCLGVCSDLATLGSVVGFFESLSIWFSSISLYYLSPWWLFIKTSVQSWHVMSQTKKNVDKLQRDWWERLMGHKFKSSKSVSWRLNSVTISYDGKAVKILSLKTLDTL